MGGHSIENATPGITKRIGRLTGTYVAEAVEKPGFRGRANRWGRRNLSNTRRGFILVVGSISIFVASVFLAGTVNANFIALSTLAIPVTMITSLGIDGNSPWYRRVDRLIDRLGIWVWWASFCTSLLLWCASAVVAAIFDALYSTPLFLAGFAFFFISNAPAPLNTGTTPDRVFYSTAHDTTMRGAIVLGVVIVPWLILKSGSIDVAVATSASIALAGIFGLGYLRGLRRRRVVFTEVVAAVDPILVALSNSPIRGDRIAELSMRLDRALRTRITSSSSILSNRVADLRLASALLAYAQFVSHSSIRIRSGDPVVEKLVAELKEAHHSIVTSEYLEFLIHIRSIFEGRIDIAA